MHDSTNITRQLEEIRAVIENSDNNPFITVWIPILVVFIGAFIAYIVSQIEKKRQRESLRQTIVLWLRESIKSIEAFIYSTQRVVDESKAATVLDSTRLFTTIFDLQWIKEFPIDKVSDALVARLRVGKNEKSKLAKNFYDLYDCTKIISTTHTQVIEAHSDYNRKMDYLKQEWDNCFTELGSLIKDCLVSTDLSDSEKQLFMQLDSILTDFYQCVTDNGGIFRRDLLNALVQEISVVLTKTYATPRLNEVAESSRKIYVVLHNMESLHADMIYVFQTVYDLLQPSNEQLSELVSFYERHRIKGIFSLSNKVA